MPAAEPTRHRLRDAGLGSLPGTAAEVLDQVARELQADDVRLVMARNIGQVRDVVHAAPGESVLDTAYPTVDEAVTRVIAER